MELFGKSHEAEPPVCGFRATGEITGVELGWALEASKGHSPVELRATVRCPTCKGRGRRAERSVSILVSVGVDFLLYKWGNMPIGIKGPIILEITNAICERCPDGPSDEETG